MKILTLAAMILTASSLSFGDVNDDLYQRSYDHALELVLDGNLHQARLSFEKALTYKPDDPNAKQGIQMVDKRLAENPSVYQATPAPNVSKKSTIQLSGNVLYYLPSDDDSYGSSYGAEAQLRYWVNDQFAIAPAIGILGWHTRSQYETDGSITMELSKDRVEMIPLGLSALYQVKMTDRLSIQLEGGVRYVIINSDLSVGLDTGSPTIQYLTMEFDDGVVGIIGADLLLRISDYVHLQGGIGYQVDLVKGDINLEGVAVGENELQALYFKAGLVLDF